MKVALVHDYLNQYGGAERVLETFCEIFPDAPVYTLFYDKKKTLGRFEGKVKSTSFLDRDIVIKNHRFFIPLMPLAASMMRLAENDYDIILSSSAGYGKGITGRENAPHIVYCHTPLRYAWEYHKYFNWGEFLKFITSPMFWYLRRWDYKTAQKPEIFLANSNYIADKIKNYYGRKAEVLYPPVDLKVFYKDKKIKKCGYFLAVGRLMGYKRFDLIIEAFNKLGLPLLIVGDGPELKNLKKLVRSASINFTGFVSEAELRCMYNEAEAVIFPQIEDFGLVAAESLACGTPVIAFSQGGAREIVQNGINGIFFYQQTPDDLIMAVKKFLISSFNSQKITESAKKFSKAKFKKKILNIVENVSGVRYHVS
ncbi:MAG: group 1 glycosyl transferase [Parcubacteria group bacterium Athens0714_26]|nr:MAG: group 1 glycosyl transferase [Parcubacteria group bacterium Athens1014_26]TSD03804.1 MAG: group 1 glycosyl transferase [Parcubacteria group bacterium Athens0714_26]